MNMAVGLIGEYIGVNPGAGRVATPRFWVGVVGSWDVHENLLYPKM